MDSKRSSGKKIARALMSNHAAVLIRVLVALALTPFLVHSLGDTQYGIWTILAAFSGYMCLLDLGIVSALTKFSSQYYQTHDNERLNQSISTCLFIFLCISVLVILLSPLLAKLVIHFLEFDAELTDIVFALVIITSFDVTLFVISGVFRGTFEGFLRQDITSAIQIFSLLLKATLFYLFLSQGYGLITMSCIAVTGNIVGLILFYRMLKTRFPMVSFDFKSVNRASISKIFAFSRFTFLSMLANQVIFYSDAFIIGYFLGAAAVTYYTIPWSLMEYVKNFCLAISNTFIAVFAEHDAVGDKEKLYASYTSATRFMLAFSNLLCIGMMVFGAAFISIWMGPKYGEIALPIVVIFATIQLVMSPQDISLSLLQGLSRHKYYAYLNMAVSVANFALSIWLVQDYGIVGVALGAAIPQFLFYVLFVPRYTTRVIGVSLRTYLRDTYLKALLPSLVLGSSLLFCLSYIYPDNFVLLFVEACVCAALYLVAVYLLMLNADEQEKVRSQLLKRFSAARAKQKHL